MIRVRKVLLPLIFASLLLCSLVSSEAEAALTESTLTDERTIYIDSYFVILHVRANELCEVNFAFEVLEGGPVDVIVIEEGPYHGYRIGANVTSMPGSVMNFTCGQGIITVLSAGAEYYVVVDNTDRVMGGASPTDQVDVAYSVSYVNATLIEQEAPWALVLIGATVLVFLVFVAILFRFRRRDEGAGLPPKIGLGMKYCPQCNQIVQTYVHTCPRCGKEW